MTQAKRNSQNAMNPLPSFVRASAWDQANMQMRAAGRTVWSEDDYNLAAATQNRLIRSCYGRSTDADERLCFIRLQIAESFERQGYFGLSSDFDEVLIEIDAILEAPVQEAA